MRTLDAWLPEGWPGEAGHVSKLRGVYEVANKGRTTRVGQSKKPEVKPTTGPRWFKTMGDIEGEEVELDSVGNVDSEAESESRFSEYGIEDKIMKKEGEMPVVVERREGGRGGRQRPRRG